MIPSDSASVDEIRRAWPRRRTAGPRNETVLEAVLAAIRARGCERVRFEDVARIGGSSIGSLQYLFGSRGAMLVAGFEYGVERDLTYLDRLAESGVDPAARLLATVESLVGHDGELSESRIEWLELWHAGLRDPDLFRACVAVYEAWRERFRRAIADGIEAGIFDPTVDVDSIIAVLFAFVDGMTVPLLLHLPLNRGQIADMITRWLTEALGLEGDRLRRDPPVRAAGAA
jgi:AcrR family transcriptional regulator